MAQGRPRVAPWELALGVANAVLSLAYPVVVWLGLTRLGARGVGVAVLALLVPLLALRLRRADRATFWAVLRLPLAILSLIVLGVVTDDRRYLLALPVLINAVLLATFAGSLRGGAVPMIERFARLEDPALTPEKVAHCRRWTARWSVFFVLNGATAGALGALASPFVWAAYTGGVAYALMGAMFAAEYVTRKARFREFGRGPHDRLLARLFPPPPRAP